MSARSALILILSASAVTLLMACAGAPAQPIVESGPSSTATPLVATATGQATATPIPPSPTPSPEPTATVTATPQPTSTPEPTATPEPTSYVASVDITLDTSGLNDPRLDKEVVGAEFAELAGTPFTNPQTGEATGSGRLAFEIATVIVLGYLYGIDEPHLMPYEELKASVDDVAETVPAEELVQEIHLNLLLFEGDQAAFLARVDELYGQQEVDLTEVRGSWAHTGELLNSSFTRVSGSEEGATIAIFAGAHFKQDVFEEVETFGIPRVNMLSSVVGGNLASIVVGQKVDRNDPTDLAFLKVFRELLMNADCNPEGTSCAFVGPQFIRLLLAEK